MNGRPVFMLMNHDPQQSCGARERMELALTLCACDWPLTLGFFDAGVLQLVQPAEGAPLKDFAAALGSLELFGVRQVLVDRDSLQRFAIDPAAIRIQARVIDRAELARQMAASDLIL